MNIVLSIDPLSPHGGGFPFIFQVICVSNRLDPFYVMQRRTKLVFNSHGAYRAFLTRQRDAFFVVYHSEFEILEATLRPEGDRLFYPKVELTVRMEFIMFFVCPVHGSFLLPNDVCPAKD